MLYEGAYKDPTTLAARPEQEIAERRDLLDAIARRDVSGARRVIRNHIRTMRRDLIEVCGISNHTIEEKTQQMGLAGMDIEGD